MHLASCVAVLALFASVCLFSETSATFCRGPPRIYNGWHSGGLRNSFRVGTKITYSCKSGYRLEGSRQLTCALSRRRYGRSYSWKYRMSNSYFHQLYWSPRAPKCIRVHRPVTCLKPRPPTSGYISGTNYQIGAVIKYGCRSGHYLVGNANRMCLPNGLWTGTPPICFGRRVECPSLPNPSNGRVKFTQGRRAGAKVWYSCNSGFKLVGSESRVCRSDQTWSSKAPSCASNQCPSLSAPRYGSIRFSNGRKIHSTATYSCNTGFVIKSDSVIVRVCDKGQFWRGKAPSCIPVNCGSLNNPSNGKVSVNGSTFRSVATYKCKSGFSLVGDKQRICQSNGKWSRNAPTCKRVVCKALSNIDGGRVSTSGNTVGSRAKYSCLPGYKLSGQGERICQSNGQWSGEEPKCIRIVCSNLPGINKGRVRQVGNVPGSSATYSCMAGYELVGNKLRTCQSNGQWSGSEPSCKRQVTCDNLRDIPRGSVSQRGNTPGSTATYSCVSGYELVGNEERTCQNDGEWSGSEPSCTRVTCDNLRDIPRGSVSQRGSTPGSTATYSCVSGYELVGNEERTCQEDGEWSGSEPSCGRVTCDNLRDIPRGSVSQRGNTPGSTATYSCVSGYKLVGNEERTCQDDGEWSGSEPSCRRDIFNCGALTNPENGRVNTSNGTQEGAVATYSCKTGYTIKGVKTRTCTRSGWSNREPTCEIVDCGPLSNPRFGTIDLRGTTFRSVATYECTSGYRISNGSRRTCQANGEWSGVIPTCRPVDCGPLPDPFHGRVLFTSTTFLFTARYICTSRYFLVGVSRRTCQADGTWSGEAPQCISPLCPELSAPDNGGVAVSNRTVGSIATYSCNDGFTLEGGAARTCSSDGSWSGSAPTCIPEVVNCGELTDPENGMVMTMGTSEGSKALYTCTMGFMLEGPMMRICQSNGQWSGKTPTCESVSCGRLNDIPNGSVQLSGTTVGSTATYSCRLGYTLSSTAVRECQKSGVWSGTEPVCTIVDCGDLPAPANGERVFPSGRTTFESTVTYSCNDGFSLQGQTTRTCGADGTWSDSAPTCVRVVRCRILGSPENGQVVINGGRFPGSTARYTCEGGYVLNGDQTRTCQDNGVWTGRTDPTCSPIDCGTLSNPANGTVQLASTTLGSAARYNCNLGFELNGTEVRICLESGKWSDEAPVCNPIMCPNLRSPVNGEVSLSGITLGSTATYTCNEGFILSGNRIRSCLTTAIWSGEDPTCIVPPPGCGDPGTPANGRRIGNDFFTGSVVFFRCFDDYDLVGSKFRECQENGLWSGVQPTCTPFPRTCVAGVDHYDRCGRKCKCEDGRFVECCRMRRDYAGLSSADRLIFINTYLQIVKDPIYGPRYTTLINTYMRSFKNNITQSTDPLKSQFFMFNRYFMLEFEDILRDFNCSLTIPYYDWTPFPVAPYTASVWGNTDGFGDTARPSDKCVIKGPFRVGEYTIAASAGGGCLKREYRNQRFPSRDIVERDLLPLPSNEFSDFHRFLHLFIGINVQCFIGGTICSSDAVNDPVYLLHIAQLDSILMRWQSFGRGRDTVRYSTDGSLLLESPGFTVQQFNNNLKLPYNICLFYGAPVLLKNHPPPSALQTFGTPALIRTMDCSPMEMMDFVGMSAADHQFMEEHCKKMRVFRSIRNVPTKN